jgi:hypothetical protein
MGGAVILVLSMSAFAGDVCHQIKSKVDAFTGQPVQTYLAPGGWRVEQGSTGTTLQWTLTSNDSLRDAFPKDGTLGIRLEDGTMLALPAHDLATAQPKLVGQAWFTDWEVRWDMSADAAAALARSTPAAMQSEAIGQQWTMAGSYKPSFERLHEVFACLAAPATP